MNIAKSIVYLTSLLFATLLPAEEITTVYGNVTFTMSTTSIEADKSITAEKKTGVIQYLKGLRDGGVDPFEWESKVSSPQGGDYATKIFWTIIFPDDLGLVLQSDKKLSAGFIFKAKSINLENFYVLITIYDSGDTSTLELVYKQGLENVSFGRSECFFKKPVIPVEKSFGFRWDKLQSLGITIGKSKTDTYRICPEMLDELQYIIRPDTMVWLARRAKDKQPILY